MMIPGIVAQRRPAADSVTPFVVSFSYNYPSTFSVSNVVVAAPTGVELGDLLLAFITHRSTITPPAGWSLARVRSFVFSAGTQYVSVYSKTAGAGDIGANTTWSQGSSTLLQVSVCCVRSTSGTPLIAQSADNFIENLGGSNWTGPQLTATKQSLAIAAGGTVSASTSISPEDALTMSEIWTIMYPTSVAGTSGSRLAVGRRDLSSGQPASGYYSINLTTSTNSWGSITLIVESP